MLNRKLEVAALTVVIGYFLVPFIFSEWRTNFFTIGLVVSAFAVPFVFLIGIPFSWLLQNKLTNPVLSLVLHGIVGGMISGLFGLFVVQGMEFLLFFMAGLIYAALFALLDYLLQKTRFYKKHSGLEAT